MIVRKMDIWRLKLAFLSPIKHNLANHENSENIVIKISTDGPRFGYGEGIPRTFVTGEQMPGSLTFLQEVLAPAILPMTFSAPGDVTRSLTDLYRQTGAIKHPGAFCALETALLDAAGRTWDLPVADFIGPRRRDRVTYSAVVPMASERQMAHFFNLIKMNQMQFLKLKVGTKSDLKTLKLAREKLGWEVDIRVDANAAWSVPEAIKRLEEMAPYKISAAEQPVAKEDFAGLKAVSDAVNLPIIADESLCNEADAQRLIDLQACQIFNLRLSKCGGLAGASRIRQMAEQAGIRCQLGCHVGETSILSAAGRHFAMCFPDLVYVEGSFSAFFLSRDLVQQPLAFNYAGQAPALPGPGLGVEVMDRTIEELAVSHLEIS
jgi:L-alanine-DL-glutamate epimerase-like enolase superfamily enzyme